MVSTDVHACQSPTTFLFINRGNTEESKINTYNEAKEQR